MKLFLYLLIAAREGSVNFLLVFTLFYFFLGETLFSLSSSSMSGTLEEPKG
jgi:hypothetical protein